MRFTAFTNRMRAALRRYRLMIKRINRYRVLMTLYRRRRRSSLRVWKILRSRKQARRSRLEHVKFIRYNKLYIRYRSLYLNASRRSRVYLRQYRFYKYAGKWSCPAKLLKIKNYGVFVARCRRFVRNRRRGWGRKWRKNIRRQRKVCGAIRATCANLTRRVRALSNARRVWLRRSSKLSRRRRVKQAAAAARRARKYINTLRVTVAARKRCYANSRRCNKRARRFRVVLRAKCYRIRRSHKSRKRIVRCVRRRRRRRVRRLSLVARRYKQLIARRARLIRAMRRTRNKLRRSVLKARVRVVNMVLALVRKARRRACRFRAVPSAHAGVRKWRVFVSRCRTACKRRRRTRRSSVKRFLRFRNIRRYVRAAIRRRCFRGRVPRTRSIVAWKAYLIRCNKQKRRLAIRKRNAVRRRLRAIKLRALRAIRRFRRAPAVCRRLLATYNRRVKMLEKKGRFQHAIAVQEKSFSALTKNRLCTKYIALINKRRDAGFFLRVYRTAIRMGCRRGMPRRRTNKRVWKKFLRRCRRSYRAKRARRALALRRRRARQLRRAVRRGRKLGRSLRRKLLSFVAKWRRVRRNKILAARWRARIVRMRRRIKAIRAKAIRYRRVARKFRRNTRKVRRKFRKTLRLRIRKLRKLARKTTRRRRRRIRRRIRIVKRSVRRLRLRRRRWSLRRRVRRVRRNIRRVRKVKRVIRRLRWRVKRAKTRRARRAMFRRIAAFRRKRRAFKKRVRSLRRKARKVWKKRARFFRKRRGRRVRWLASKLRRVLRARRRSTKKRRSRARRVARRLRRRIRRVRRTARRAFRKVVRLSRRRWLAKIKRKSSCARNAARFLKLARRFRRNRSRRNSYLRRYKSYRLCAARQAARIAAAKKRFAALRKRANRRRRVFRARRILIRVRRRRRRCLRKVARIARRLKAKKLAANKRKALLALRRKWRKKAMLARRRRKAATFVIRRRLARRITAVTRRIRKTKSRRLRLRLRRRRVRIVARVARARVRSLRRRRRRVRRRARRFRRACRRNRRRFAKRGRVEDDDERRRRRRRRFRVRRRRIRRRARVWRRRTTRLRRLAIRLARRAANRRRAALRRRRKILRRLAKNRRIRARRNIRRKLRLARRLIRRRRRTVRRRLRLIRRRARKLVRARRRRIRRRLRTTRRRLRRLAARRRRLARKVFLKRQAALRKVRRRLIARRLRARKLSRARRLRALKVRKLLRIRNRYLKIYRRFNRRLRNVALRRRRRLISAAKYRYYRRVYLANIRKYRGLYLTFHRRWVAMRRVARRRRVTRRRKRRRHIRRRKNNRAANRRRRALLANVQCRSTGDPHYTAFSRKHFNIYGKQGDLTLFALPGFSVVTTLRYGAKWGNRGLNAAVKINYRGKNLVYNQHGKYAGPRAYRLTTKRGRGSRRLYFNVAGKRVTVNMGYVRVGRRNKLHAAGYYNVYITTQRRWANMSTGVCNRGNKKAIRGRSRYWLTLANRLLRKLPFRRRRRIARRCRSRSNVAFYNCVRDTIKKLGRVARRVRRARRRRAIRWDRIAASWLRRVKNAADRRVIARKCSKRYQRVPVVRLGKKQAGKQLACRSTGDPHYRSFHGRSFNIYSFQGSKTLFQYRNVRIVTNIKYGAKWGKRGLNSGVYVQINGRRVASYNDLCRSSGSRKYAMKKNRANYWLRANDGQKIRLYLTCNRVSNSGKRHFSRAYYNVYVYARALASLSGSGICTSGAGNRVNAAVWTVRANALKKKLPAIVLNRVNRICRRVKTKARYYNCVYDVARGFSKIAARRIRHRRSRRRRYHVLAIKILRSIKNKRARRRIALLCKKRYGRHALRFYRCVSKHKRGRRVRRRRRRRVIRRRRRIRRQFVRKLPARYSGRQVTCRSTGDPHYRSFAGRAFNIYGVQGRRTLFQYKNVKLVTNIKYGSKWGKRGLNSQVELYMSNRRVATYTDLCKYAGAKNFAMKRNRANYWVRARDGQRVRFYMTCHRVSNKGKSHFSRAYYNVYVYARQVAANNSSGYCANGGGHQANSRVWTLKANQVLQKMPAALRARAHRACRKQRSKARYYNCVYDTAQGMTRVAVAHLRARRLRQRKYRKMAARKLRAIRNKAERVGAAKFCKARYGRHAIRYYRCIVNHYRRFRRRLRKPNAKPIRLPRKVLGRQLTCASTGDPHYTSFHGRRFNLYGIQGRKTLFQYRNIKLVTNIKYGAHWHNRGLNSQVELYISGRRLGVYTDLCRFAGAKQYRMHRNRANFWVRANDGQRVRMYMTCHRVSNKGKRHFSRAYYNVYVYARQLTALNSSGICTSGRGHRANSAIWARRTAVILRKLNAAQRRRANHICRRQKLRARKYNCVFDVAQGMARAAARHIARRRARQRKYLARANKILRRVRNARARANIQRACYRRYRKHATRYLGCVVRKYNAWKRAAVSGKLRKRVTCVSSGDPHYRAFNGRRFDIYGKTGRMTLFKYGNLKVDTLVSYGKRWRNRGLNTGVQIFLGRKLIGSYDTNGRFGGKSFARMVRRGKRGAKTLALKVRGHVVHVYIRYQYLGYGGIRGYYNVTLRSNQYVSVQSSGICARGGSGHLGNSIYWLQQANRLLAKIKNKARRFKIVRACRRQKPRARFFNCVNDAYVGFLRLAAAHARRRRLAYIRNLKLATYWFNKITVARQRIRATSYCRRRYSRNGRLHAKRYMMCARAHARRFTRGLRLHLLKRLSQRRYANCVRASVRRYLHGKRLLYILRRRCVTKFVMVNKGWIKIRRGKNVRAMQRWVRTSRVTITRHCARFRGLRTRYLRIISRWRLYFLRLIRRRRLVKYSTYRPTRICQRHNHIQYKNLRTYEETKVLQTGDMALNTRCGSVRKYVRFAFRASRYIWNKLAKQERAIGCQSCWSGKKPTGLRKWKCLAQLAGGLVYSCAGTHALYRYADFAYKRLAWFVKKNGAAIGAGNGMKVLRYLKRAVHRFKYQRHSLRRLLATMRCSFCAQKV
eukprot:TRINITY_DN63_c0_g1_i10.p1 TRINITY_DN63_c0_g1~~TRINITY_DN63_c0_g1_i10.p1  ORF type:complete len:2965 (+),score=933.98 TRINITY_DN63_c0_g1_i10:749-9643(+)